MFTMFSKALLFATLATAAVVPSGIEKRQYGFGGGSSDGTALTDGQCGEIVLIYARASTETGALGQSLGPPLCSDLGSNAICQGVLNGYSADLESNALPAGTSQSAIDEAVRLFNLASTQCPNAAIVAGGYSQGTAVIFNAIENLSSDVKAKVKGAVLFGYTHNAQNGGEIPTYPPSETLVYCNADDGVCNGSLTVTYGHFEYYQDVAPAAQFLLQKAQS